MLNRDFIIKRDVIIRYNNLFSSSTEEYNHSIMYTFIAFLLFDEIQNIFLFQ
jgi:hypothetical protein